MATIIGDLALHPGFYIKEEMEARGWLQRDLAFILGCKEQAVNPILSGKRGVSPEMAKALGNAFDVPAEFFLNLQKQFELAQAQEERRLTRSRKAAATKVDFFTLMRERG